MSRAFILIGLPPLARDAANEWSNCPLNDGLGAVSPLTYSMPRLREGRDRRSLLRLLASTSLNTSIQGRDPHAIVIRHFYLDDCFDREHRARERRPCGQRQNSLQCSQGRLCCWRLWRPRYTGISRSILSTGHWRGGGGGLLWAPRTPVCPSMLLSAPRTRLS